LRYRRSGGATAPARPVGLDSDGALRWHGWTVTSAGCWEFGGPRNSGGYGKLRFAGKHPAAHRLAYEAWVGSIPNGLVVRHRCDNRPCVNPQHLELGTVADNNRDRAERGRSSRGSKSPNAKLTEDEVTEMRALYTTGGWTYRTLGARYGVSDVMVGNIVRQESWRHAA
jgi:hypothetical protein